MCHVVMRRGGRLEGEAEVGVDVALVTAEDQRALLPYSHFTEGKML